MARILILTPQLPIPPQALTGMSQGTTIRNFNLIAGLAKRHDVDLLTFRAGCVQRDIERGTSAATGSGGAGFTAPLLRRHRRGTGAGADPGAPGARHRAESPA